MKKWCFLWVALAVVLTSCALWDTKPVIISPENTSAELMNDTSTYGAAKNVTLPLLTPGLSNSPAQNNTASLSAPATETGCKDNAACPAGKQCIDRACKAIAQIYKSTGCTQKCNFNQIKVKTSDGGEYLLNRGKGDYTSAGALEWLLVSGPDYCKMQEPIVLLRIKAKSLGKIVQDYFFTLKVGEMSSIISHPQIKKINFTLQVIRVNETCA